MHVLDIASDDLGVSFDGSFGFRKEESELLSLRVMFPSQDVLLKAFGFRDSKVTTILT